tara:strand:- start:94 stop:429 length:336 start_codon:yes stop_codon:yes gene_type:complete
MKKEKLLGLGHTDDSYWFRFKGNNRAIGIIEAMFDMDHYAWQEHLEKKGPKISYYQWLIQDGDYSFLIDQEDCFAYVIVTKKKIHFILRKIRKYEEIKKKILDKFEVKIKK